MKVQAYITFAGRCEEALEFYKKSVGAEVTGLMRWKESPEKDMKGPPGYEEKIMNAAFRIGETQLMADDGMGEKAAEFKGMKLVMKWPTTLKPNVFSRRWAKVARSRCP